MSCINKYVIVLHLYIYYNKLLFYIDKKGKGGNILRKKQKKS